MPKVSVIIPSYNHERFVKQAIESVLGQTFKDVEVCITDDGSTDGTPDVVASIRDERIRFKRFDRNRGVSAALNDAIRRSSGEFIAELNSDDYFLPDKIAMQVEFLEAHPGVGAVFGYPAFVGEDGGGIADDNTFYGKTFRVENRPNAEWLKRFFDGGNCLCHPSSMIRRRCHDEIGLYDERLAQVHDLDLWLRLLRRHAIHILSETLVMFRIMDGNDNASAPRAEILSRTNWEAERVLRRYLELDDALFRDVFNEEIAILSLDPQLPRTLQLARIAVSAQFQPTKRVGLELLYEATPAQTDQERPESIAGRELIELSGRLDLYCVAQANSLSEEIETQKRANADLEARLAAKAGAAGPSEKQKSGWFSKAKRIP